MLVTARPRSVTAVTPHGRAQRRTARAEEVGTKDPYREAEQPRDGDLTVSNHSNTQSGSTADELEHPFVRSAND